MVKPHRLVTFLVSILVASAAVFSACGDDNSSNSSASTNGTTTDATSSTVRSSGTSASLDSVADLVEKVRASVVHIQTESAAVGRFGEVVPQGGVGTGFI